MRSIAGGPARRRGRSPLFRAGALPACAAGLFILLAGCGRGKPAWDVSSGVALATVETAEASAIRASIEAAASAIPPRAQQGPGLAGVLGGVRLKAHASGRYDVLIPVPQMTGRQIPVCYSLSVTPPEALVASLLQQRSDGNVFVNVGLNGVREREIAIDWSGVILIVDREPSENGTRPEEYLASTACAQSDAGEVEELAERLYPRDGALRDYAASIQRFIQGMARREAPRTLDALAVLRSGEKTICTANANLACALMRERGAPCRSLAVVPINSQRLEMHRVVEYFEDGSWIPFDPSLLHDEIPLKPWRCVIMAKTTLADEEMGGVARVAAPAGCPFGQEAEISRPGLCFWGTDFFWTVAAPLAGFEAAGEAVRATSIAWTRFLETGTISPAQLESARARTLVDYLEAMTN